MSFKQTVLIASVFAMAIGCSNENNTITIPAQGVIGKILDTSGNSVKGVTVKCMTKSAISKSDGTFVLDISPQNGTSQVVHFTKAGYISVHRTVKLVTANATRLDIHMARVGAEKELADAAAGGIITGDNLNVKVAANSMIDAQGNPVTGKVTFRLTHLDPSDQASLDAYPGPLVGQQTDGKNTPLQSYGVVDITAIQNGEKLQVATGKTLHVEMPAPKGMTNPPAQVALWSFDDTKGVWIEEGTADYDQANNVYVAEIPHMSPWNCDQPFQTTCVKGQVIDEYGKSVAGGMVSFTGSDLTISGLDYTDDNGGFCMSTPLNAKITVTATHPSGGGASIETTTPDSIVPYPPQCDKCKDIGTITVKSGIFQDVNGTETSCKDMLNSFAGTCAAGMQDYTECFKTEGKCTIKMNGTGYGNYEMTWANGSKIIANGNLSGNDYESHMKTYGPDGGLCGTIDLVSNNDTGTTAYTITDANGQKWTTSIDNKSGDMDIKCANGESVHMTRNETEAFNSCMGTDQNHDECSVDTGGGNGTYTTCSTDSDCTGGDECCKDPSATVGACIQKGICPY